MQGKYILKLGHTGDLIRVLQELLNISIDGEFCNETRASVRKFQKEKGLKADGIVGPLTWMALGYNPL